MITRKINLDLAPDEPHAEGALEHRVVQEPSPAEIQIKTLTS